VKLPFRVKAGFGIGDLGGNLFFTVMGFYSLNYLTDTVKIGAALAGTAVLIGKLWDAFIDPMMGFISDRTRTRWGRRRPYLLFGALPLLLAMWYFFSAPNYANAQVNGFIWAALALCLLNTAYTVVNIPYGSLTPELTNDFKERTSLNGFRFFFAVIGTILGASAVGFILKWVGNDHIGFNVVGLLFGVIMALTILTTFFSVREPDHTHTPLPKEKFLPTFLVVFKNSTYMRLAVVYTFNLIGITFVQSMLIYYYKYIYMSDVSLALLMLLGVAMASVPVSVLVAKHIGKKRTYQIALGVLAVSCLAIFFFGHTLGANFTLGLMVFAGIGVGFGYVPPFAMLPDVVEVDAVQTKTRKEGSYYGMWTFFSKIGVALAVGIAGIFLGLAHYDANLAIQPASAIFAIRLIIGPIAAVIFIAGILLVNRYPLDEKAYEAIMAQKSDSGS
jgi:GPH family glycoside/pentoside/hexuronide:cation symporter